MIIVKEGNVRLCRKVFRFECEACGCIFEADSSEYRRDLQKDRGWVCVCVCPTCKYEVYSKEEETA